MEQNKSQKLEAATQSDELEASLAFSNPLLDSEEKIREVPPLQVPLIFCLAAFSFFTTCFFFLKDKSLYWDTAQHFVQFRDNLHSVNAFGEIAYWFPHVQFGWPSYYYSILGFPHGATPLFGLLAFVCWALGQFGIILKAYHPIYVFYFGFLTPVTFLFAVNCFAREFLRTKEAVSFALIIAAFSPGVMVNITDIGFLEPAAYSLFFGAAFLAYFRKPGLLTFGALCLSCALLGLACNYAFMFWNLIIIPLFVGGFVALAFWEKNDTWNVIRQTKAWKWLLCAALMLVGFLPNLVAYRATQELVKPHLDGQAYKFEELRPGNPLAVFTASLPGFGFEWAPKYREYWSLLPRTERGVHLAYNYMGLLSVPLMILALIYGNMRTRTALLLLLLAVFGVINLAGYSPLFAWLLAMPSPLRSVNHYSDLLFRSGGFLVILFGAAFGLETLRRRNEEGSGKFLKIFIGTTLAGLVIFILGYKDQTLRSPTFGFTLFIGFVISIVLASLTTGTHLRAARIPIWLLLLISLIDVSTQTLIHIRRVFLPNAEAYRRVDETPSPTGIGLKVSSDPYYFINSVLVYRSLAKMIESGFNMGLIHRFKVFSSAHTNEVLYLEQADLERKTFTNYHSIQLDAEFAKQPAFAPFLNLPSPQPAAGRLEIKEETYNRLVFDIQAPEPVLLFIGDSYSPYWRAKINGKEVPVARALYNFKAVPVPAGQSRIELQFAPPFLGLSLFLAYAALIGGGIYCVLVRMGGPPFKLLGRKA